MRTHTAWPISYKALGVLQWGVAFLSIPFAAALKTEVKDLWEPLQGVATWLRNNAWIALPLMTGLLAAIPLLRARIGEPWCWKVVRGLLGDLGPGVFTKEEMAREGSAPHEHRATLFKYQRWRFSACRWPWHGWLVPVERSSHTTRKGVPCFKVPDNPDKAEGVAGAAWTRKGTIIVNNLPAIKSGGDSEDLLREYANQTFKTLARLRRELGSENRPRIRALCGVPIEVGGRIWGVVVFDSTSPEPFNRRITVLPMALTALSRLLLEAKL